MKNAFYFPVPHNATFGERITALRKSREINSVQGLAEEIFEQLEKYNKTGIPDTDNATIEGIRKRIASHLKPNCNPKMEFIKEYCDFFQCEADFLLGYIDFPTHKTQNVYEATGLNEKALHELNMIQLTDRNENSITLFPSELFAKMNSNGELTLEEQKQMEEIFFDTSGKYMHPLDSHRPLLMDLLNYMLASGNIEKIIIQFRNFVNARFKVPVYYDNDKNSFIYPNNDYSYTGDIKHGDKIHKGNYILNFASSPDNPNDNAPIYLSDTFFDTVTLKDIEKIFYEMRTDYEKGHGD
ncbi:MAG: hypothetical protein J6C19_12015 [Lachnospiraceae bacterium]|nr:hypothetical protein [Lachnospiraceae bacterium]